MLVGINDNRSFAGLDRHRHDFRLEHSVFYRLDRPLVAEQRQFVLFFAADVIFLRQVFSGVSHVITHNGANQTVGQHTVEHFSVAHPVPFTSAFQQIRGLGHALNTYGNRDIAFAEHDRLAGDFKRLHAGTALLVNRAGVAFRGHAAFQLNLTPGVSLGAGFINLAAGQFLHICCSNPGLLKRRIDGNHAEFHRTDVFQFAEKIADWRPFCANYPYFLHHITLLRLKHRFTTADFDR